MKKLLSLALLLLSAHVLASYEGKLELLSPELLLAQKEKFLVLDTRSPEEFAQGHIEGAVNIPHSQVETELELLKSTDKTIVVHCRSGRRATVAEQALLDAGFTNLMHLEGDMKAWVELQLPLVTNLD